jgi:tRNA U34 5-methylaminomethyl-2-thiouridine-forming methyltransferase MnmC
MNSTLPPNHRWVETDDGSFTLFSEMFQEACHSTSGATQETLLHYIQGCKIKDKILEQNSLAILEVGFGLGVGFLTTFNFLIEFNKPWSFLSLELDEKLLEWFRLQNLTHPFLKDLQWIEERGSKRLEVKTSSIQLVILCGDARQTLPLYLSHHALIWNAIYQDAFSPKKNPALWTVEWFELLRQNSHPEVLLSTYSSSSSIRKSLIEAGWKLHPGEKFGPKRSSTRASLQGESAQEILLQLERSPVLALKDDNLLHMLTK